MTAWSGSRRNSRGRGLPGCGSGVTVPISTKPKPRPQQRVGHLGVLVEARRDADRIGEVEAEGPHRQPRIAGAAAAARSEFQGLDGERMGVFRIERPQQRPGQAVEKADQMGTPERKWRGPYRP